MNNKHISCNFNLNYMLWDFNDYRAAKLNFLNYMKH